MKTGKTLIELAEEVMRQKESKRDFLIDTRQIVMNINENDSPHLQLLDTNQDTLAINNITHRQIGTNIGIPAKYYDAMLNEYPELLAQNINGWFQKKPDRRMVRTLDGHARAFLSDRYRRIDNNEILESVLPIIGDMPGAHIESCEVTDRRMYIKIVNPRLEAEVVKGDIVQAGIIISNSEIGHGSVSIQPLIFRLVCLNGMIVNDVATRKYHIGRGNESDNNYELYSDDTLIADDKAFLSYNNVILAGVKTDSELGYCFATWIVDADGEYYSGSYFMGNYKLAKIDFAKRSGLVPDCH